MAGSIVISSIQLDSDNNFSILSNTGATLVSANGSGLNVSSSLAPDSITSDKIVSVANTKIAGNIVSSQITSVANTQLTGTVTSAQVGETVYEGMMFRNRIINGDMRIDQRNAGASVTPAATNTYYLDRWKLFGSQTNKFNVGQNLGLVTPPAGFEKYLGLSVASSVSVGASDYFLVGQQIEGNNISDLGFGSSNAKTVTISFWVRSSLTGTFGAVLENDAQDRAYPFTYTISVADTWEYKTVTIPGDTTGTWLTNNGTGFFVLFGLGAGSNFNGTAGAWAGSQALGVTGAVSVIGTLNATWYITGVQLEVGSVATPFERRPYGTELSLCQRYFCKTFSTETAPAQNTGYVGALGAIAINAGAATALWVHWQFPSEMRAVPTLTTFSPQAANANWYSAAGPSSTTTAGTFAGSTRFLNIYNTNAPAAGADIVYYVQATASSEL